MVSKKDGKVSIVVPAHNEEENIESTLTELSDCFRSAEIIVVCNGCTDRTYEIARKVKRPGIRVMNFHERIGKGGAILEGFREASGEIVGFVDADGSFGTNEIEKVIEQLEKNDAVIASKWKGRDFVHAQSKVPRKVGSRVWNNIVRTLTGLGFEDTQAGLKFFRRPVVDAVLKEEFVCKGFDFDVELLYIIKEKGFRIDEIFVEIRDGGKSTFDMRNSPDMLKNLLRLYFSEIEKERKRKQSN